MRRFYAPGHKKLWIPAAWTVWSFEGIEYALFDGRLFERTSRRALWRESVRPIAMVT